jgi:hypothetical protein
LRRAVVVALLLFALAPGARGDELDVFHHPVSPQIAHKPVLVIYANKETRRSATEPAVELAVRLHDVPYVTVVRVDMRGIPTIMGNFAKGSIKDSYNESLTRAKALRRQANLPPPEASGQGLVYVADPQGAAHAAAGLAPGFKEALAVVIAPDGHEVVRAPFPRDAAKIEAALKRFASH